MIKERRGRFAPTPSGELHIGNAAVALLAWLQMRSIGGTFVLRMEDLDRPRSRPEYARLILEDLKWLGIDWDEGPDVGGPYGPYEQSERNPYYEAAFDRLNRDGWLYPCFCSRKELRLIASAPHGFSRVYPGICRDLTSAERVDKAKLKDPSFRFTVPEQAIAFDDLVMERQAFPPGFGGDFVVKRADGIMSYQLAVVVDDMEMGITDVLRGSDLLDSTPRQILLNKALGLSAPQFAHVPLFYGPDGERLSKRHGTAITLAAMRRSGTKPEDVIGYLAWWTGLINSPEPLKASDLVGDFDLRSISRDPVVVEGELLQKLSGI
ncbi:MAG TPA: tRNA glutamyl-Q(34) synthetase GluQRS [Bacillales bacterium]|nr:tRNA glutamyl-Q(34) synthetase GluQRS [Bacillales bacterium]